jgi:hypothetical protein
MKAKSMVIEEPQESAASKHSSMSCFRRDNLYRPHMERLWQIGWVFHLGQQPAVTMPTLRVSIKAIA